ncbi:MAG: TrmH family RNA methyltransferase, partial [Bacteroidota bacterium]
GYTTIYIYDKNGLLDPPNNKVSRGDMEHLARVWTAGAIEYIEVVKVPNGLEFIREHSGRSLATVIDHNAINLHAFKFKEDDLLVMGPEKAGLAPEVVRLCDSHLFLPNKGHTDCLNVSVSLGVFLYAAQASLPIT